MAKDIISTKLDDVEGTTSVQIQLHHTISIQLHDMIKEKDCNPNILVGYQEWLRTFWLPTIQKKHPNLTLQLYKKNCETNVHVIDISSTSIDITPTDITSQIEWEKNISNALKKIVVEDLGHLNAIELYNTIPIQDDQEGRGRNDLQQLEQQLNVKVVFVQETKHVLLVGAKSKLTKKCFVLRNLLSHYYWRLSGKEITL